VKLPNWERLTPVPLSDTQLRALAFTLTLALTQSFKFNFNVWSLTQSWIGSMNDWLWVSVRPESLTLTEPRFVFVASISWAQMEINIIKSTYMTIWVFITCSCAFNHWLVRCGSSFNQLLIPKSGTSLAKCKVKRDCKSCDRRIPSVFEPGFCCDVYQASHAPFWFMVICWSLVVVIVFFKGRLVLFNIQIGDLI